MKRLVVSTLLARPWLQWSQRNGLIGSSARPFSDRMQMLPAMLIPSDAKAHFYSARGAVGRQGHDLMRSGQRGLQAFASPQIALNLKPCVVIYDGVCHLCNAGVKWIIKVDKKKKISFCALQSQAAEPYMLLYGVTREDVLRRFIFVEGPASCHQASTAALKVASHLPFPYSALSVFMVIPVPIRDAVYDYVAKRRYDWFGRSTECITPTDDVLDRFVDKLELQERMTQEQDDEEPAEKS